MDATRVWQIVSSVVRGYFTGGPHRKVLRRKLILWSILPAILVLAVAAKLMIMVIYGYSAKDDYLKYDSYALNNDVRMLKSLNVIDSYKAYFADGDRLVLEGKLADARARFTTSLSLVDQSDSCPVRINLEVVLETLGDLKNADKHRDQAKPLWQEALTVVQQAPGGCFDTATESDEARRKHLNETEKRLQDKLKDPPPAENNSGGGGGGGQNGQGGQNDQGGQDNQPGQADQPGQNNQNGQADPGQPDQGGQAPDQPGQAPAGSSDQSTLDTVGADRIATDSGGIATHHLNPHQGDPGDVLRRLLEDSDATGTDRE